MNRVRYFLFVLTLISASGPCVAFETETHALITNQVYQNSVLSASGNESVVNILGLDRLDASLPFGVYWKAGGGNAYYTDGGAVNPSAFSTELQLGIVAGGINPQEFERCQMQEFLKIDKSDSDRTPYRTLFEATTSNNSSTASAASDSLLPIRNWLVRGAIREDDLGTLGLNDAWKSNCGFWWTETTPSQPGQLVRSLRHFYNPINGSGLDTTIYEGPIPIPVAGDPSVFWALGYVNNLTNPPVVNASRINTYSYEDAHNSLYWALTRELTRVPGQPHTSQEREADAYDRMFLWATTFRSLGDVVHLLEDAGQPQHTRNDPHSVKNSDEQQAFEGYTNIRVLGQGTLSTYSRVFFPESLQGISAPPLGSYPGVGKHWIEFASPLSYFSTRFSFNDNGNPLARNGLADYTNRGFFTGGTLPGANGFDYPKNPATESNQYQTISAPCIQLGGNPQLQDVMCTHYTSSVPDGIASGYTDELPPGFDSAHIPLVSEGVLAEFAANAGLAPDNQINFALGMEELDTIGNLTIPRAVGYATGMINYFFRGVGGIAITPPASGVYAILDHGQTHSINAKGYPCVGSDTSDGCPIFGFTALQLNMQNVMSPIVESGTGDTVQQHMTNGTLVAVAHFHRNTCYQPDLSGEAMYDMNAQAASSTLVPTSWPSNCPDATKYSLGRSPFPEIAVSTKIPVDANGHIQAGVAQDTDINGTSAALVQFDFSGDPIPINATDLYIQVVFQGTIGDTATNDANKYEINSIVVGSIDVSEPTYSIFMNMSNYYYDTIGAAWMTVSQAQDRNFHPLPEWTMPSVSVCDNGDELLNYGANGNPTGLAPGHAIRLAMILDKSSATNGNSFLNRWVTPISGMFNGNYVQAGGTVYGSFATFANFAAPSSSGQPPYVTIHVAQASLESNAKGDYLVQPIPVGVGAAWGDNISVAYQSGIASGSWRPVSLLPPIPDNPPLTGSTGVFLPDPTPSDEIFLNLPLPSCSSQSAQGAIKSLAPSHAAASIGRSISEQSE